MESIPNLISCLDSLIKEFAHPSLFPSSVIVSFITLPWTVMFSNLSFLVFTSSLSDSCFSKRLLLCSGVASQFSVFCESRRISRSLCWKAYQPISVVPCSPVSWSVGPLTWSEYLPLSVVIALTLMSGLGNLVPLVVCWYRGSRGLLSSWFRTTS